MKSLLLAGACSIAFVACSAKKTPVAPDKFSGVFYQELHSEEAVPTNPVLRWVSGNHAPSQVTIPVVTKLLVVAGNGNYHEVKVTQKGQNQSQISMKHYSYEKIDENNYKLQLLEDECGRVLSQDEGVILAPFDSNQNRVSLEGDIVVPASKDLAQEKQLEIKEILQNKNYSKSCSTAGRVVTNTASKAKSMFSNMKSTVKNLFKKNKDGSSESDN